MSHVIPICSKQISYLLYDDSTHELLAHYHSGEVKAYPAVSKAMYERLMHSENRYDDFVQLTVNHGLYSSPSGA